MEKLPCSCFVFDLAHLDHAHIISICFMEQSNLALFNFFYVNTKLF